MFSSHVQVLRQTEVTARKCGYDPVEVSVCNENRFVQNRLDDSPAESRGRGDDAELELVGVGEVEEDLERAEDVEELETGEDDHPDLGDGVGLFYDGRSVELV